MEVISNNEKKFGDNNCNNLSGNENFTSDEMVLPHVIYQDKGACLKDSWL